MQSAVKYRNAKAEKLAAFRFFCLFFYLVLIEVSEYKRKSELCTLTKNKNINRESL